MAAVSPRIAERQLLLELVGASMSHQYLNRCLNYCLNPYLLLVLSIVVVVTSIVDKNATVEGFVIFFMSVIMVLLALRMVRVHHRTFSVRIFVSFLFLITVSIVCDLLVYWTDWATGFKNLFFVSAAIIRLYVFGYGWLVLVKTLLTRQRVTDTTIITAVVAYLFIGIIWSFLYFAIWTIDPQAFHFSVVRDYDFRSWNLVMYFSFMTLTTVGYGDIIPVNQWLMALAMFEAMTGAIYLTVVVARLVSLYSSPN